MSGRAERRPGPRPRIIWFADLEALSADLRVLEVLRDEAGLTTVAPESHISHTSGFRASASIAESSPFRDWASRPGLGDHRAVFGAAEPAMAVLPGVVGGVHDGPLLLVIEECRRLGLEVWGHAGMWCYGAEVFPEYAAIDLFGKSVLPASLPWGTMFCPSRPEVNGAIAASLAEAATDYDLDGWFLDHARHPSPGFGAGLLACGCEHCGAAASSLGVDLDACRDDILALAAALREMGPRGLLLAADLGPAGLLGVLERFPGALRWLEVRAAILAQRFAEIAAAIGEASRRTVELGSDVFPPSVALLGGHDYAAWTRTATYLTGGFGARIGWASVARVTAMSLGEELARSVPGLSVADARTLVAGLVGTGGERAAADDPTEESDRESARREIRHMGAVRPDVPVYPPIPSPMSSTELSRTCAAIVEAGLDGAMVAGLETADAGRRRILRTELAERLA